MEYGKCCFCNFDCNPSSQACNNCIRRGNTTLYVDTDLDLSKNNKIKHLGVWKELKKDILINTNDISSIEKYILKDSIKFIIEFKSNTTIICYFKLKDGEEIYTELREELFFNSNPV